MNTRFSCPYAAAVALMLGAVVCGETQAQTQLPTVKQRRVTQPAPVIRPAPAVPIFPVAIPETDPNTPLGLAMAQNCATGYPQTTELVLPGANGDIKLDRCYGGREQLSCEFSVLKTEANSS